MAKQRLVDGRRILRKLRLLAKEVRGHHRSPGKIRSCRMHSMAYVRWPLSPAPEYHPRCVSMDSEWTQATGLCQDPRLLRPVLSGGGAEGAGLWPSHYPLHEGNIQSVKSSSMIMLIVLLLLHSFCHFAFKSTVHIFAYISGYLQILTNHWDQTSTQV